ncbi:DUF4129 domain-containing transglutaminase family protein [Tumebacillus lipolyticus]|uniref:DUF4129 domain-containing transglutaminase family protein n=1 Tax=Tumebacillus lipolyticus TaxID=1280370 RepID=A0ABW5A2B6_9BACL
MLQTARWITGSPLRDIVLYALVWIWLSQLLVPISKATNFQSIGFILIFLLLLFTIDLLLGKWILRFLLKLAMFVGFMYFYHYSELYSVYNVIDWVPHWFRDLDASLGALQAGKYGAVLMAGKTTATLLGLWLLQALIRLSMRVRAWMFVFLLLGMIGLGVIDTFYVREIEGHLVLFLLLGLVILAFRQLPAVERLARMPRHLKGWPGHWLVWTLILSLIVTGVGLVVPKAEEPAWPDPVAFLKGIKDGGKLVQKIGYGNNDDQLGGPFEMDDTVVFTVTSTVEGYYRGETKATYTGKGWLSVASASQLTNPADIRQQQFLEDTTLETKQVEQTVTIQDNIVPLLFGHSRVTGVAGANINRTTVKYSPFDTRLEIDQLEPGDTYTVYSQVPYHDEVALRNAQISTAVSSKADFLKPYLSLPSNLPARVKNLAWQIASASPAPYEQAKALEDYLRRTYRYETKNVPIPDEDQDFVDQFLFESKRGYCDHFSTAFVVMARSIGLPARWVKGFTRGDVDLTYKGETDEEYLYVVKNKNAHSWAEVYFDGIGWVAFEPTSSFQMRPIFKPSEQQPVITPPVDNKKGEEKEQEEETTKSAFSFDLNIDWKQVGIYAGIAFFLLLVIAFFNRRRLLIAYYLRRAYKGDGDVITNAVLRLMLIMGRFGWKRQTDMSLREYALYLSDNPDLRGREMIPLARIFERVRYGKRDVSEGEKSQIHDLWSRIVRKVGRLKKRR